MNLYMVQDVSGMGSRSNIMELYHYIKEAVSY